MTWFFCRAVQEAPPHHFRRAVAQKVISVKLYMSGCDLAVIWLRFGFITIFDTLFFASVPLTCFARLYVA